MFQALKTLCLIHFWGWKNSLFPLLALWRNKNWPPSMKVKKLGNFLNKSGLSGCKWSNLNGPGAQVDIFTPSIMDDTNTSLCVSSSFNIQRRFAARMAVCVLINKGWLKRCMTLRLPRFRITRSTQILVTYQSRTSTTKLLV